ncbi:MAG: hypothetical protein NT051_00885 [Candidatus Micrarchaeota archaeon]|nr:hypothetical protein [Candidatus Micrarchaeota archaeon]
MPEQKEADSLGALREITITLDTYDDIFSDFDPRPFTQRALSEDFVKEINRRYLEDRRGRFVVNFTIPSSERDLKEEFIIKKRLREHFAAMVKREGETIKRTKMRGYLYIAVGMLVLLANTYVFLSLSEDHLLYQLLTIMLVPAGWYGMFTGIGKVVDEPYDAAERKKVHEKFEKANYIFLSDDKE